MKFFDDFSNPFNGSIDESSALEEQKKRIEIAKNVVEMMNTKGWPELVNEMKKVEKLHSCEPSVYAEHPELASHHAGILSALRYIQRWISDCNILLETYEQEKIDQSGE